jgi:hypothetical protein
MANSSSRYLPSRNTPYDFEKSPRNISQLTNRPDLRRIGKLAGRRRRVVASKEIMVPIVCRRHALKVAPLNPKRQRIRSQTRPCSFKGLKHLAGSANAPVFIGVREVVVESVRAMRGFEVANRYGEAALMAISGGSSVDNDPVARWESAMEKLYPTSPTARQKVCPRGAFLGLCEEGPGRFAGRLTRATPNGLPIMEVFQAISSSSLRFIGPLFHPRGSGREAASYCQTILSHGGEPR